jgi:hypothetical protein
MTYGKVAIEVSQQERPAGTRGGRSEPAQTGFSSFRSGSAYGHRDWAPMRPVIVPPSGTVDGRQNTFIVPS